jgi:hypothetical protein
VMTSSRSLSGGKEASGPERAAIGVGTGMGDACGV